MKSLSEYTFKELDNLDTQKKLIEENEDPEFMSLLFAKMNKVRRDSLNPSKEDE